MSEGTEVRARCLLCGAERGRELSASTALIRSVFAGSRVVRCGQCTFTYLFPTPSLSPGVYEEAYFASYIDAGIAFPTDGGLRSVRHQQRLRQLAGTGPPGRLLEVGCGTGSFLNTARDSGWQVSAVDVSHHAVELVRRRYGIEVFHGSLLDAAFDDACFDAVHMSHVVEHLEDPLGTLEEVHRVLRPGGLLGVEVPNELENLGSRLMALLRLATPYPVGSTHLWFFSPDTLTRLTSAAGFATRVARTFRDTAEPRLWRRAAKHAFGLVEEPLGMAPLVELIAERTAAEVSGELKLPLRGQPRTRL